MKRRTDKIIFSDIMKMLKMLNVGRTAAIEQFVRKLMEGMGVDHFPSNRTANIEYLNGLRKQIGELEATLRKVPDETVFLTLFTPDLKIPTPDDNSIGAVARAIVVLDREAKTQSGDLVLALEKLRMRCEATAEAKPGTHGSFGHKQYRAALAARLLFGKIGKQPHVGLDWRSPFRRLASLFYEVNTGLRNQDMERACREALRLPATLRQAKAALTASMPENRVLRLPRTSTVAEQSWPWPEDAEA